MRMALPHHISPPWKLTDLDRLLGRPLSVEEANQCLPSARARAANVWLFVQSIKYVDLIYGEQQVLKKWKCERHRNDPEPLWGDEVSRASLFVCSEYLELTVHRMQIEYVLIDIDTSVHRATLLLSQDEILSRWDEINRSAKMNLW